MGMFSLAELRDVCDGDFSVRVDLNSQVDGVNTDSRQVMPNSVFVALEGDRFDAHDFLADAVRNGATLLCTRREKAYKAPENIPVLAVSSTLAAYQAFAALHRRRFTDLKTIALTGSCGKTSTKEILRQILIRAVGAEHVLATTDNTNNQIGVPQNLLRLNPEHRYAVIEMGTNHPGEIEPLARIAMPRTALVVSIGCCHLEFFKDLNGVAAEKSHIFSPFSVETAVLPQECAGRAVLEKAALRIRKKYTFGETSKASVQAIYRGGNLDGSTFDLVETATGKKVTIHWNLTGRHQALNAACAAAAALAFGIPLDIAADGIHAVRLPGMRMKQTRHGDAVWVNDAYNANPDSMCASLAWLAEFADPARLVLALGDMGELGVDSMKGHLRVLTFARENLPGARLAVIGPKMTEALAILNLTGKLPGTTFPSAEKAVEGVRAMVRKDDLVFLKGSHSMRLEILEPAEA